MNSPYKYELEKLVDQADQEVTIDRDGAPTLKGILRKVTEGGCTLALPIPGSSTVSSHFVFVAYEDIRGVGHSDWDPQKIDK